MENEDEILEKPLTPWEEAIRLHKIPKIYQKANFHNAKDYLGERLIDIGKRWLRQSRKPSLFLTGIPGCGKTYFMTCLLRGIVDQGSKWNIFKKSQELFDQSLAEIFESKSKSNSYFINKFCEVPFLFLDDVGIEKMTERVQAEYCQIIDYRISNNLPFVFTSNFSKENFGELAGDRVRSRLETCFEIVFKDQDLRRRLGSEISGFFLMDIEHTHDL